MDKTQSVGMVTKNKQGFALMLTLSVLAVVIALTTVLLSYFDEVQQDSSHTKALIQANVFYADVVDIFQNIQDKNTLFPILYRTDFPLATPDNRFSLLLHCRPLARGVNINWLATTTDQEKEPLIKTAQELFDFLSQEFEIIDPARLLEMINEEINGNHSVTNRQSRLHQKNGIMSYQQFSALLSRYQFEVDDPNIGAIPWEKYFSFASNAPKIDAEYASAELIAFLFEIDIFAANEWVNDAINIERVPLETFVEQSGGDYSERSALLAGKDFLDETECSVGFAFEQGQYRFGFEYIQGEAKHFEFYGKQ